MAWSAGPDAMACVSGQAAEKESPQVMGPGILPTRDSATIGHAAYSRTAMLGKRRKTPQRGAAQDAAAPEGTDLKTEEA